MKEITQEQYDNAVEKLRESLNYYNRSIEQQAMIDNMISEQFAARNIVVKNEADGDVNGNLQKNNGHPYGLNQTAYPQPVKTLSINNGIEKEEDKSKGKVVINGSVNTVTNVPEKTQDTSPENNQDTVTEKTQDNTPEDTQQNTQEMGLEL